MWRWISSDQHEFDQKDTGFERFTFIPDDPENLSKFHNASMKLSMIIWKVIWFILTLTTTRNRQNVTLFKINRYIMFRGFLPLDFAVQLHFDIEERKRTKFLNRKLPFDREGTRKRAALHNVPTDCHCCSISSKAVWIQGVSTTAPARFDEYQWF